MDVENFSLDAFLGSLSIPEIIILCVASGSLVILLSYYFFIFSKVSFLKIKSGDNSTDMEPVSVIICARNEALNLEKNLPAIFEQDYPEFQVVVVNDCSWDETEAVLDKFTKKYENLKIVTIKEQEKYSHGKKFALTLGIKAASNELLVMTDADCFPSGKNWLKTMVKNFSVENQIVLGYGSYHPEEGLLNKLIRFDTFHNALQYFSFALAGTPYMGVGRNLAYKRSLFFAGKGFARHQHILSGDDDLFVNENATSANTVTELNPESFTFSIPKKTWNDWRIQKIRHLSTSVFYKFSHRFFLGLYWVAQIFFGISIVALLFVQQDWKMFLAFLVIKIFSQMLVFGLAMKKMKESGLVWLMPFLDLILILIYPTFAVQGFFSKQTTWK